MALSTSGEKIDALAMQPDGALLISTIGAATVKNGNQSIKAADEDLLAFTPTSLGATTAGTWQMAFDGSTLAGMAVEDVTSAWYDGATMTLYLSVMNNFNVKGVAGTNRTVLAVAPGGAVSVYWNAAGLVIPPHRRASHSKVMTERPDRPAFPLARPVSLSPARHRSIMATLFLLDHCSRDSVVARQMLLEIDGRQPPFHNHPPVDDRPIDAPRATKQHGRRRIIAMPRRSRRDSDSGR